MADISNISITRNALLSTKDQIALTRAGYDLLDKKRVALWQEIVQLEDEVVQLASELEKMTAESRKALAKAEALIGETGVRSAAMGKKHEMNTELEESEIMGVRVPRIRSESARREFYERDISMLGNSPVVDEVAEAYEKNVDGIIQLADGELRLAKLLTEIRSTTRRLKALEHIVIPRLQSEYDTIRMALEERERSEHYSLKLAKKLLERKNQSLRKKRDEPARPHARGENELAPTP